MHQKRPVDFNEIVKLVNEPLREGETWYLLDKNWYEMFRTFHQTGDKSSFPGVIDNSGLFKPIPAPTSGRANGFSSADSTSADSKFKSPTADAISVDSRPLRSDLSEAEGHFIVVPEKCWNMLKDAYGVVSANHAIKRRVIEVTPGQTVVEIQPISLRLCLYGGKEATVERCFSRMTTLDELQHEMRNVFNVSNEKETKLWINSQTFTFKPSSGGLAPSKSSGSLQSSTTSSIKPPPTPPPMPSSSSTSNISTPTVVTRQAASSMNKPIALPDSSTSPNTRSSSMSTSDSPNSNASTKESSPDQTLADAGVSDTAVVTLEVINADGTWPSSRPRFGTVTTRSSKAQPGLCGLSNMGNTCFMNSALQCLSNTPPLTDYILADKFVEDINPNNPLGMHGEIARTYAELIKVMWSGNNTSFLPREFKCAVSRFAPQFTGFAQQDCQELMAFLLDGLHEDLNRIKNKPYIEIKNDIESRPDEVVAKESWANYKKRNDSIVVDTFHAMLKSTLVCPGCQLVSVTFDPFCYLSLPLPVKREKQVSLTFLPAPVNVDKSKIKTVFDHLSPEEQAIVLECGGSISSFDGCIEEHAGYLGERPQGCKMQVPRSGPVSEICDIVTRIINEERPADGKKIRQDDLIVAEMTMGRISKVYGSDEHYNQICDEIVVVEKASKYVLPLYLRERKSSSSVTGMSKPVFLHVPDLKYETLYKSVIASLSNLTCESTKDLGSWYKMLPPTADAFKNNSEADRMECDDDDETTTKAGSTGDAVIDMMEANGCENEPKTNGNLKIKKNLDGPAFDLCLVNSIGSSSIETLGPVKRECDYSSKLYFGATFSSETTCAAQFAHHRQPKTEPIETFTPKASAKPTLQLKDCITQFTNVERLGADDPWYCPKCKKHQQATKKFDIWSLPKVLIIHLKRFSFSRSWRDKIDTLVEFPIDDLNMSRYVLNPEQKNRKQIYSLIGVANHFGGLGGGHYTAFAKNQPTNAWYNFDDALVSQTSASNVVTRSAYVLFYQLQEDAA